MDELNRERLAEGRRILAELDAEHGRMREVAQAEAAGGILDGPGRDAYLAWDTRERVGSLPAEEQRCLMFAAAELLAQGEQHLNFAADCFRVLAEMRLDLATGDIRLLAAVAEPGGGRQAYEPFRLVIDLAERLVREGAAGATALADALAGQVAAWNVMEYLAFGGRGFRQNVAVLRDRALVLAGRLPAWPPNEGVVGRDDGWGLAVIGRLGLAEGWPAGVAALLEHCVTAKPARPSARWQQVCRQRLDAVGDASGLLRGMLELVVTAPPVIYLTDFGRRSVLAGYNEQLIRGLVWAAGVLDPVWLPDVLRAVAARCLRLCSGHVFHETAAPGEKIPYACFWSLAHSGSDSSLIALTRIGRTTANRSVLRHLGKTLEEVAARRGMSAASLLDWLTPDHGLSAEGQVTVRVDDASWTIRLDDQHGAVVSGPPGVPVPSQASELVTQIRATVSMIRARLEEMFAGSGAWHAEDFAECYVRHPVTGWLARRLVWTYTSGDGVTISGFPEPGGSAVRTVHGQRRVPAGSVVRLWHPVLADASEVAQMRELASRLGISQPVCQLWREIYRITPAEQAGLHSGRYGGHVLRFAPFYGIARRRGWSGGFLSGAWDGGQSAVPGKDFPLAGLRASCAIARLVDLSHDVAVDLCVTENVTFSALADPERTPVPLADVPPEVFSEAMRDLDLVISMTTVANDPAWLQNFTGHPILGGYWERIARGGLDELRAQRRQALTPFWPHTADDRFELTDRDLRVRGSLATYRIDLATASVQMQPAGKWLSFDKMPPGDAHQSIAGLPALDDEILRRILIRAAVLADDEQLASEKLLKQIRG